MGVKLVTVDCTGRCSVSFRVVLNCIQEGAPVKSGEDEDERNKPQGQRFTMVR